MKSTFEELGGTYKQVGDYLLPDVEVPENPEVGFWGMQRRKYLLEHLPAEDAAFDVDVLLVYDADADKLALAKAVAELTAQGKTVSTQKSIPEKLRYRQLLKLTKEGAVC